MVKGEIWWANLPDPRGSELVDDSLKHIFDISP
jgi:hypothetical protein